jgi:SAM-dependent methyltransferase
MAAYWDGGARRNALWYVDTSLAWDEPDLDEFFATGRRIVEGLVDDAAVGPSSTGLVVEIGSGLGRTCIALAERFDRVIGVDVSSEMVRRASQLAHDERISYRLGDGRGLRSIGDETADLVLSFAVFQHIPKAWIVHEYVAEAARVLRPGGVLAFQWNNLPGPRRWAARSAALSALQRTGLHRDRHERHAREFLGTRIPLPPLVRTLEANNLDLADTAQLGSQYATAWAVRGPGSVTPSPAG